MLTLYQYVDVFNLDLVVRRHANQVDRWTAAIEHAEFKDSQDSSILLSGTYGQGSSPLYALRDLITKLHGKWIVINAGGADRRVVLEIPDLCLEDDE